MDARCDVDTIALKDAVVVDNVLYIYADAKTQRERMFRIIAAENGPLDVGCPAHRVHGAPKLDEDSIASNLGHAATLPQHERLHHLGAEHLPAAQRLDIIRGNEPRETGNISESDRREPAIDA